MSQYKVSLHDCNKDPNNFNYPSFKFRTVFWIDKESVSIGKLVRKRITTKTVLEVFKFWNSFPKVKIEKEKADLERIFKENTQIKEYETKP